MIERRDEELSRIYGDAEGPRPPQRVDDNILAASQRVASTIRRPAGFGRRWGTPVALAATVLVTFTLALMVFERESGLDAMAPAPPRAGRSAKVLPAEPRADQPRTPSPVVLQPIAPAPPISQALQSDRAESTASPGARQPAFAPEVPRTPEALRKRDEAKPAPAVAAPAANLYSSERAGAAQPAPDAPRAPELRQQAPQPTAPPAAGVGGLVESASTVRSAGAFVSPLAVSEAKERTPEKWLADIRKLKSEGKAIEAERDLVEFKKRYPDYILPEDLR
jgi:hypothetical protein